MEIWEYCRLIGSPLPGQESYLCFFRPTEIQTYPLKPGTWEQAIARLGQQGWELVSVQGYSFFFKRPQPQTRKYTETATTPAVVPVRR